MAGFRTQERQQFTRLMDDGHGNDGSFEEQHSIWDGCHTGGGGPKKS